MRVVYLLICIAAQTSIQRKKFSSAHYVNSSKTYLQFILGGKKLHSLACTEPNSKNSKNND